MPITRKQFDLGIDSEIERWMREVHEYLGQNRDMAYSASDLDAALETAFPRADFEGEIDVLEDIFPAQPRRRLQIALEKLVALGAIEARVVDSQAYYAYCEDLPEL